jgi:DNA polymerase III alpha subunit
MESLVKAGAFDRFADRSNMLHNLDLLSAYANRMHKEANSGQVDLFGSLINNDTASRPQLALEKAAVVYSSRDQLLWERELLGLYLSQHPLSMFETILSEQTMPIGDLKPEHEGRGVVIGGSVNDVREITTRNGQKMAFVKIEDKHGEIEVILFPGAYQQTAGLWERDRVVLARGKISAKDREGNIGEEVKVLVDDAREITTEQAQSYQSTGRKMRGPGSKKSAAAAVTATKERVLQKPQARTEADLVDAPQKVERVYIRLVDSHNQQLLLALKKIVDNEPGKTDVVLVLGPTSGKQIIKLPRGIRREDDVIERIRVLVGKENLKVQ